MVKSEDRNIILVDDDPVTVQICNMIFRRTIPFAKIVVFENGLEAKKWIEQEKLVSTSKNSFVLLLDLNMPTMDGWEFLNYFEKLDESTRRKFSIHILTSSIDKNDLERSLKYHSVRGFHSKPITHKMIEEIFAES